MPSPGLATVLALFLAGALIGCDGHKVTDAQLRHTVASPTTSPTATPPGLPGQPPADPSALAAEIDRAQKIIDDASASPRKLETAARFEQLAFRELANRRPIRRTTLSRLSPHARSAAAASVLAADAISKIVPPQAGFPHWSIVASPQPTVLLRYFHTAAATYGIPWQYLAAIEFVETRMGRVRGLSPAGAQGPMQFMPATWAEYGRGSIESQRDSIMAAAHFLAANGGPGKIAAALLHYNLSHSYVATIESYAGEMRRDGRAFYGYYYWRVFYRTVRGVFVLPVGYPHVRPERLPG